ncbi:hypothetical protein SS50377_23857 [Spironucleus salmonicida]|uniref:Myb-like DNA-binding domain-containing protein n=1 Tax=Spironucleus salmonicida TaxID=348837 RepID=V6LHZ8_9EUKA|nr:hypothetical protein SS50377_23857 [Spironucleus salmonicida]|eukprot:EST44157.1 Hypothetical protein SS50377_16061 [Spironucleus salmonicida]
MQRKQIWTFEQIEYLASAFRQVGMNWKMIQSKFFPKYQIGQIRNAYYKFKKEQPDLFQKCTINAGVGLQDIDLNYNVFK